MTTKIAQRDDVNPDEGVRKYGDVAFADPVNHKYPIDTAEHVRAAWSYIHHENDAARYSEAEVNQIKAHIRAAAETFAVELRTE